MNTSTIPWFPSIRRWLRDRQSSPTKQRSFRKLLVESLEDRTGLSVVPGGVVPLHQQLTQVHRKQSTDEPELTAPIAAATKDTLSDPAVVTDAPLVTDGIDTTIVNPTVPAPWENRQEFDPTGNKTGEHQPAGVTTILNDSTDAPSKPTLLARTAYDALAGISKAPSANVPATDSFFQIQRTPVTQQSLEVQFEVRAYSSSGTLARQQSAIFEAGSGQINVTNLPLPLAQQRDFEIITLTLHARQQYQITQPAATIIVASSQQPCSEAALLRASQEGHSPEAMTALVEMHRPRVLQTCYQVLGNMADAEDAAQLVFLMFAQQQYKLQQTVGRWLHTVARNVAISFLRARQRRRKYEQKAIKADVIPTNTSSELREEIDHALTQLPAPLRQAVKLRYLDGWSQEEAAEILGWPRGTLAQRAARGLQELRLLMGHAEARLLH